MRLTWLTDTHLNFIDTNGVDEFLLTVKESGPEAIAISGDLAEAHDVIGHLRRMEEVWKVPVYFVLGSHDYYGNRIREVRSAVGRLASKSRFLHYLTVAEPISLSPDTVIMGHDSWQDGRFGDFMGSPVVIEDFRQIKDLMPPQNAPDPVGILLQPQRLALMQLLAEEAANHIATFLPRALSSARQVVLVTHVPPFRETCWYRGKVSDNDYLPFFACKAVGDVLLRIMSCHRDRQLLVLCGHTHGGGEMLVRENLRVMTGRATYGEPEIQKIITLP